MDGFLHRDRQVIVLALVSITVMAWVYLILLVEEMGMTFTGGMQPVMEMVAFKPWTIPDFILMFLMWVIMMIGMMTPSAAPMILLYSHAQRKRATSKNPFIPTAAFFSGYIVVWSFFSIVATILQMGLEHAALLSPMMMSSSAFLTGFILITAGVYQWTPVKNACLTRCREPVWFLSTIWRDGPSGAFTMGLIHGAFCLGCCWMLMLLLFAGGIMNLLCIVLLTVLVLLEKVSRVGQAIGKFSAVVLIVLGVFVLVGG